MVISYLVNKNEYSIGSAYTPAPAHRLDRNTAGIVVFGKNLPALQTLAKSIQDKEKIPNKYLKLNNAKTYMDWALQVFELRINPDLHKLKRAKEETQMLGVFFLYAPELLEALKATGDIKRYKKYKKHK